MAPYVGEIRMFAGNFAPVGWLFCEGQLMPISGNETLFNLIGTTYGGDGQNNFALPDLRGRLPIHTGSGFPLAVTGGVETVSLTTNQLPSHSHPMVASTSTGSTNAPSGMVTASSPSVLLYIADVPDTNMSASAIAPAGGSQPHSNFQPYLCIDFIISLYGIYPSPT